VAEVWNISKPKQDSGLALDQRVITIGKSRINRSGETLIQTQNEDLTVSLVEAKKPEEMQTRAGTVAERIMNRLQTNKQPMSRLDLNADPLVGGSVAAIRKTLQRLENRGVLEVIERSSSKGGRPEKLYSALRAWGESGQEEFSKQNPCNDKDEQWDTRAGTSGCPIDEPETAKPEWDTPPPKSECPIEESSAGAGSDPEETVSLYPRAGEERSADEIAKLNDDAWNAWD
jgi:ribosomal protein S25